MSSLWDCCELSVSLQLSQLALCNNCMVSHQTISWISHSELMVWAWSFLFFSVANDKHIQANSQRAHSNLTLWVIRWALRMLLAHTFTGLITDSTPLERGRINSPTVSTLIHIINFPIFRPFFFAQERLNLRVCISLAVRFPKSGLPFPYFV